MASQGINPAATSRATLAPIRDSGERRLFVGMPRPDFVGSGPDTPEEAVSVAIPIPHDPYISSVSSPGVAGAAGQVHPRLQTAEDGGSRGQYAPPEIDPTAESSPEPVVSQRTAGQEPTPAANKPRGALYQEPLRSNLQFGMVCSLGL